jgi:hypothetical protein
MANIILTCILAVLLYLALRHKHIFTIQIDSDINVKHEHTHKQELDQDAVKFLKEQAKVEKNAEEEARVTMDSFIASINNVMGVNNDAKED